ncbi:MAG: efflux RND transporter permease subunit [Cellulosilyticaceae bacterium]
MKKIANFIVNYPKLIAIFYGVLILASLLGMSFVQIEYDLSAYLPDSMPSYKGKVLLENEFNMGGLASLMLPANDLDFVRETTNSLAEIPGIKEVLWFENKVKDNYTLIDIVFEKSSSSPDTIAALEQIETLLDGTEYYLGGESSIAKDMQQTTSKEILIYSLLAFLVITIILLLGSHTYVEPIYFFVAIGVAILINMGSNFIFGKISSNTNSVASILQLAVSMDYSIFLLHRYYSERQSFEPKKAMAHAIQKTTVSVSSSALTTVAGFLALVMMKYGIGKDMGFVLAKGVVFSLIAVLTLLPALILLVDTKFKFKPHKVLIPSFEKLSSGIIKSRYVAFVLALLVAIPTFFMHTNVKYYYSNEKTLKDSAVSITHNTKIKEIFGLSNQMIVMVPLSEAPKIKQATDTLTNLDGVEIAFGLYSIVSDQLPITFLPKEMVAQFQTDDYTYFAVVLDRPMEGANTSLTIAEITHTLNELFGSNYFMTGESVVYDDLQRVTSEDFVVVTWMSIILVGLILVFTFKSILLPIILLFIIQLGIWMNLSIPYMLGHELNFISFIILGAIQLGATVDYAILFTSTYKEYLEDHTPIEAIRYTIKDTSRAVLTSALILIAGTLSVYLITTIRSASELTLLIARGSLISVILVYVLLPAMLIIFDPLIRKTTLGWPTSKN